MAQYAQAKDIEGFNGLYQVAPDGTVWSTHSGEPVRKSTFQGELGPRVELHRNGRAYQPYIHTLVRKAFGEEPTRSPGLSEYVDEHYGDHPEVREWMAEAFAV